MPTDAEMMERLKVLAEFRTTAEGWGDEFSPDDLAAIRHALALIERYEVYHGAAADYILCLRQLVYSSIPEVQERAGGDIDRMGLAGKVEAARRALPERQVCSNCGGAGEYDHEHRDFNGEYLGVERVRCDCPGAELDEMQRINAALRKEYEQLVALIERYRGALEQIKGLPEQTVVRDGVDCANWALAIARAALSPDPPAKETEAGGG